MPIMHLNGYKIANPTVLARMDDEELRDLFRELGNEPFFIESHETRAMHELMARTLDEVLDHSGHSACRAGTGMVARSTAPTDDRATHSQGLERTRSGRAESRGLLALASSRRSASDLALSVWTASPTDSLNIAERASATTMRL
jgi:hypothetical protein